MNLSYASFKSLSKALRFACVLAGLAASPLLAQTAAISLSSGSAVTGGAVSLNVSLASSGGATPSAVEWTMSYSSSVVASVSVVAGSAATAAGKSVTCSSITGSTTCVLFSNSQSNISNGVVAVATFNISSSAVASSVPIQVTQVVATSGAGQQLSSSGTGGTISVSQVAGPALSGLSCAPASIASPGAAACTVTLSTAAAAGGFPVTLSSANTSVSVPATVTVPAAASSVAFTATAVAVSTTQTAVLTAAASGVSKTFSLAVTPALWSISGAISPSTFGSGATVTLSGGATAIANASGNYTFTGLANGAYTLTPSKTGYTFSPATLSVTVNGANLTATSFTAIATTPVLSGLSCTPASIAAPGVAACTVTLSAAAPAAGFSVTLASGNTSVSVPATVTVPSAASSVGFTATAAAVTTAQTAVLTASAGGVSKTFSLALTPGLWTISGTVSPSSFGSGATVTLTGGATAIADASGNYTFSGLANGAYTLTPSKSGYTFSPATLSVTVNGANLTANNFTAAQISTTGTITLDSQVRKDQGTTSSTVTSPTFSTAASNELLLAFIATDYRFGKASVKSVSGGGLAWVKVVGTPTQKGTAEIWRAFSPTPLNNASVRVALSLSVTSSLTVMTFTGVDTTGTSGSGAIGATGSRTGSTGAPTASLVTTRNNSWVVGVGDDPKTATSRTPLSGQTLVHQYLDPAGNTYWVQMLSSATPLSGSSVTIGDSAPTTDPYNLAIAEILAAPSGTSQITGQAIVKSAVTTATAGTTGQAAPTQSSGGALALDDLAGNAVTNACSPGGLALLTGANLTTQTPQTPTSFPLPTQLADLQVNVNGIPAPLLFASDSQVRFQCPLLPSGTPLQINLQALSGLSIPSAASLMKPAAPELFMYGSTNRGVILLGPSSELTKLDNQAVVAQSIQAGETLTIYANGLGDFRGNVPVGTRVPSGAPILLNHPIRVMLGGIEIDPAFAGLAPGAVGLSQLNIVLPRGVPTGPAIPLYIQVVLPDGTVIESNEVTVAIN